MSHINNNKLNNIKSGGRYMNCVGNTSNNCDYSNSNNICGGVSGGGLSGSFPFSAPLITGPGGVRERMIRHQLDQLVANSPARSAADMKVCQCRYMEKEVYATHHVLSCIIMYYHELLCDW